MVAARGIFRRETPIWAVRAATVVAVEKILKDHAQVPITFLVASNDRYDDRVASRSSSNTTAQVIHAVPSHLRHLMTPPRIAPSTVTAQPNLATRLQSRYSPACSRSVPRSFSSGGRSQA